MRFDKRFIWVIICFIKILLAAISISLYLSLIFQPYYFDNLAPFHFFNGFIFLLSIFLLLLLWVSISIFCYKKDNNITLIDRLIEDSNIFLPFYLLFAYVIQYFLQINFWFPIPVTGRIIRIEYFLPIISIIWSINLKIRFIKFSLVTEKINIFFYTASEQKIKIFLFIIVFIFFSTVSIVFNKYHYFTGDENHYLLITHSILQDGDIDLKNNYDSEDYKNYFREKIDDRHIIKIKDKEYPAHYILLPILLIPAYAISDQLGVRLFLNFVTCILILRIYKFCRIFNISKKYSFLFSLISGLSIPLLIFSNQVYPEIIACLITVNSLIILFKNRNTFNISDYIQLGLYLGILPWLHIRYTSIVVVILLAIPFFLLKRIKDIIKILIPFIILVSGFVIFNFIFYKNIIGPYQNEPLFSHNVIIGLIGSFFDRQFGIITYAPHYLFAIIGVLIAFRKWKKETLLIICIVLFELLPGAGYHFWWGGWCPIGKFLVSVIALFIPFGAYYFEKTNRITTKIGYIISILITFYFSYFFVYYPSLNYPIKYPVEIYNTSRILNLLSNIKTNLNKFFPSFTNFTIETIILIIFWLIMILLCYYCLNKFSKYIKVVNTNLDISQKRIFFSLIFIVCLIFFIIGISYKKYLTEKQNRIIPKIVNKTLDNDYYLGMYYMDTKIFSDLIYVRYDKEINFTWGEKEGACMGPIKKFGIIWQKYINLQSEKEYFVYLLSNNYCEFLIDEKTMLNNRSKYSNYEIVTKNIKIGGGKHLIKFILKSDTYNCKVQLGLQPISDKSKEFLHSLLPFENITYIKDRYGKYPFTIGEKLIYEIKYSGLSIGNILLESVDKLVISGQQQLKIVLKIWSKESFFFRVNDRIESIINYNDLNPLIYSEFLEEGDLRHSAEYKFDTENMTIIDMINRNTEYKILEQIDDAVTWLYKLRTKDLIIGTEYKFTIFNKGKIHYLVVKVQREDVISLFERNMEAFLLEPYLKGEDNRGFRVNIWLSKNRQKIPLLIRFYSPYGIIDIPLIKAVIKQ